MSNFQSCVWLRGERYDIAYLLPLDGGKVRRFNLRKVEVGPVGGTGQRVGNRFVGWYVHPESRQVRLRVGRRDVLLNNSISARHAVRAGGLMSQLVLQLPNEPVIVLCKLTMARATLRIIDPGYDGNDEWMDDFLARVADTVMLDGNRQQIVKMNDPSCGPWHLLDSDEPI